MNPKDTPKTTDSAAGAMFQQVLRERREVLSLELRQLNAERETLNRTEARIIQQIRSIDTLLAVEGEAGESALTSVDDRVGVDSVAANFHSLGADSSSNNHLVNAGLGTTDLVSTAKDTSERVCTAVEGVLRRAGVPMHYRQIAEAVEQEMPLRGRDPAATLLAHMSRGADRFVRVGRGVYWIAGEPLPSGIVATRPSSKRSRQVKRKRRSS